MMATKRAGRGLAPYAVLADEIDFYQNPAEQMATIEATAARIYAVTTGSGPDGRARKMWRRAQAGEGRYHGVSSPGICTPAARTSGTCVTSPRPPSRAWPVASLPPPPRRRSRHLRASSSSA